MLESASNLVLDILTVRQIEYQTVYAPESSALADRRLERRRSSRPLRGADMDSAWSKSGNPATKLHMSRVKKGQLSSPLASVST